MNQKEKRKGSSVVSFLLTIIVLVSQLAGRVGIVLVVALFVLGLIGFVIWQAVTNSTTNQQVQNRERTNYDGATRPLSGMNAQTTRPRMRTGYTPAYRSDAPGTAALQRGGNVGRMEELKDLLNAGIIDQAEYLDRMAELEAEGRQ